MTIAQLSHRAGYLIGGLVLAVLILVGGAYVGALFTVRAVSHVELEVDDVIQFGECTLYRSEEQEYCWRQEAFYAIDASLNITLSEINHAMSLMPGLEETLQTWAADEEEWHQCFPV